MPLPSPKRPPPAALVLAALIAAALLWCAGAGGFAADAVRPADAVQMLADVTLIDGACHGLSVDFGRAFQVAESMGLRVSTVMPTGALRPAFEAATRERLAELAPDELCTRIAKAYADHIPGLFRTR